eukprot:scaffold222421_cov16-Tisochrysis_lutea.AAC.1
MQEVFAAFPCNPLSPEALNNAANSCLLPKRARPTPTGKAAALEGIRIPKPCTIIPTLTLDTQQPHTTCACKARKP